MCYNIPQLGHLLWLMALDVLYTNREREMDMEHESFLAG
jgi:hypothetical protein